MTRINKVDAFYHPPRAIGVIMAISQTIKLAFIVLLFLILSQGVWAQSAAANTTDEISRGISLYKSGDYREAVDVLSVAVKKQKENADAWYYLALAQMRIGDPRSARNSIENAIKLRPDHSPSHTGLAYLLLMMNDHRKAEDEAKTAITLNSQDADAHFTFAKLYLIDRKWEMALQESEATLKIAPGFSAAHLLKAQSLVGQIAPVWNRGSKKENDDQQTDDAQARSSIEKARESRLKLERAQESLGTYLSLNPNDRDAIWWREQLEAMKAHAKQLKDKEEGNWNYEMLKDGVTRPTILYRENAKYTDEARNRRINGMVKLRVIFAVDGELKDILVVEGLEAGLSWMSIEAARKIRFKPATKDGQPVPVVGYLEFKFSL